MESIAVIKPNMTVARQESLSPFGLLTQVFTEELVRRHSKPMENYRPLRLAYLEEGEGETAAQPAPLELHLDFDINLLVDRILKEQKKQAEQEKKTPQQRILERVILREREIRTAYPDTRRVVIRVDGRQVEATLPVKAPAQPGTAPRRGAESREIGQTARQVGEGRSTPGGDVLRRSAGLPQPLSSSVAGQRQAGTLPRHTLTLASQAMSVPAGDGWTPKERETYPGFAPKGAETQEGGVTPGSILLPDVMRRRREAALARRDDPTAAPVSLTADLGPGEEALVWALEGTEQTPETERVIRQVHRAVLETLRRNEQRSRVSESPTPSRQARETGERAAERPRSPERRGPCREP